MTAFDSLSRIVARFWHPVSLPEDVADVLGVTISNFVTFDELVSVVERSRCDPMKLAKFMPRKDAEAAFSHSKCKECFHDRTLVSYYFNEGWIEFILHFDECSQLTHVYLMHKGIEEDGGVEIPTCCSYIQKSFPKYMRKRTA